MKFSIRVQYGLQAMLELALKYGGGPVQIADIAKNQKIPIRYLEQLMLVLKRRGTVASTRGKHGGYALAKHPSDVSVLEIIEAFEGPIELTSKKMKKLPVLFEAFDTIQNNIKKELTELSLEDLVFKKRQKERAYIYNI
ncbi:MAG: Rrf2 family transcriptional regulator [Candidatus Margulisiibacteriota bacterium]